MSDFETTTIAACPACGASQFSQLSRPGHWIGESVFGSLGDKLGLMRCRSCGLHFTNPRPDSKALEAFYSGDTYTCHSAEGSASAGSKAEFLLDQIERQVPAGRPGELLDFGCGGGGFLRHALQRGWMVRGFEPGRRGRQECLASGLDVVENLDHLPNSSFGVITLHHVFEHLEDHRAVLDRIRLLLAPGGLLFIEVPNVRSLRAILSPSLMSRFLGFDERHRAYPIHLSYFNSKTLPLLLQRCGWHVEAAFTVGLGIDELISRPDKPATHSQSIAQEPVSQSPRLQWLRRLVKFLIYKPQLGENLCVFARPVG